MSRHSWSWRSFVVGSAGRCPRSQSGLSRVRVIDGARILGRAHAGQQIDALTQERMFGVQMFWDDRLWWTALLAAARSRSNWFVRDECEIFVRQDGAGHWSLVHRLSVICGRFPFALQNIVDHPAQFDIVQSLRGQIQIGLLVNVFGHALRALRFESGAAAVVTVEWHRWWAVDNCIGNNPATFQSRRPVSRSRC